MPLANDVSDERALVAIGECAYKRGGTSEHIFCLLACPGLLCLVCNLCALGDPFSSDLLSELLNVRRKLAEVVVKVDAAIVGVLYRMHGFHARRNRADRCRKR